MFGKHLFKEFTHLWFLHPVESPTTMYILARTKKKSPRNVQPRARRASDGGILMTMLRRKMVRLKRWSWRQLVLSVHSCQERDITCGVDGGRESIPRRTRRQAGLLRSLSSSEKRDCHSRGNIPSDDGFSQLPALLSTLFFPTTSIYRTAKLVR